jgi:tetratricopeptide (TPR) repeat protein
MVGMVLLNNNPTPERQTTAEAETREALRLFPHNALADLQLAQIMLSKGRQHDAIDLLQDALRSDAHNRNAMTVLARAYRQTGRNDLSERFSKQADLLYQDQERARVLEGEESKHLMQADFHENLSRLYGRVGEQKKAMYEQSMARLLRENPRKAAEELQKLGAIRNAALQTR